MNNNANSDNSNTLGIVYTEQVICQKQTDSSGVSDSFINLIKNTTMIQEPILFHDVFIKSSR